MKRLLAMAFAAAVSFAPPAAAQPAAEAGESWHLGSSRSVTPTAPAV